MKSQVDVTLVEGHMGTGKTTTGVAQIVDSYKEDPTLRIFSNVHLFGIRHVFVPDIESTLKMLKNPAFRHAKLLVDESYIGAEARRSSSTSSIMYSWVMQQMRKRDMEVIWVVQNSRMLDWRIKWIITKWIGCEYYDWDDDKQRGTRKIKCIVKKMRSGKAITEKTVRYWAPQYWTYFDTNETPDIPIYECACGCGRLVRAEGKYLAGHYKAQQDALRAERELAGAEA